MHQGRGTCGEEEQESAAPAAGAGAKTCGLFIARAHRILGSLKRPLPRQLLFPYMPANTPAVRMDKSSF